MTEEPRFEETVTREEKLEETVIDAKSERSIADELEKMGAQIAAAAKTAWESEERKKLQTEISTGVQRFGQELNTMVSKASESDPAKDLKTRATRVAEDVQKTDVVEEVRKGILVGLEAINRELSKLLERLESKPETEQSVEAVAPVTDTSLGETVVVAETPVVPDVTGDEEKPVA
jgi:type II secretory pathway component PulF